MDNSTQNELGARGFYKLSWLTRIGFGAGDLAQNLIYQTVATYLLFFYTNVFGIGPGAAAFMFLIVRLVDVLWDPFVGAFVDKRNPKLGKYRSYLILGGIPLTGLAILSFWNGFSGQLWYAYVTYVTLSLCYTMVNVPYGALNASLTRDTDEITKLTSTRMFMANMGGLAVQFGIPALIQHFSPNNDWSKPAASSTWFVVMSIYALAGFSLLVYCFTQTKERIVMDSSKMETVKYSDLFTEFVRNRPLRILAFFFITAFAMMAVSNSASAYYMQYNIGQAQALPIFNAFGSIPAFIFHADGAGDQTSNRQEESVLRVFSDCYYRNGDVVFYLDRAISEKSIVVDLHRTIYQINRCCYRDRLYVGISTGSDFLR